MSPTASAQEETAQAKIENLRAYRHRLVHESNQDGNWDLYLMEADGSPTL